MNPAFSIPPRSKEHLTPPHIIAERLEGLVGQSFPLVKRPRTDGSNMRKLVAATLGDFDLPDHSESYRIIPNRGKGLPKITREYIDTYLVTSGDSYNLQVWNRIPTSKEPQIEYADGSCLCASDVRFVLVRVDVRTHVILSVLVVTPEYIEENFGSFGAPTIKHQLIISNQRRRQVIAREHSILFLPDTGPIERFSAKVYYRPQRAFNQLPENLGEVFSIEVIRDIVALQLIGRVIDSGGTKSRGQALEQVVLAELGYDVPRGLTLEGQYPDVKNQLLEIKIQDSPTVDLGKYTPAERVEVFPEIGITTKDIRYMIVLMSPLTSQVEGVILSPGANLGDSFSYVTGVSGKCQRAIRMEVFDRYIGMSVFNPSEKHP